MGKIGKSLALILIVILAVSILIMAKPAFVQSIPTPSAPTFTVQYVVYTSYVAPTYTINPYTGKNETQSSGGQVNNETMEFTIKNQPFTPYTDSNGNYIALYYNFEYKGHFGNEWTPSLSVKLDKERGKVHGETDRAIQLQSLITPLFQSI